MEEQFNCETTILAKGEKTPNGGVMMKCFYYDSEGKPCKPEKATNCMIYEYDKRGKVVFSLPGVCNNS